MTDNKQVSLYDFKGHQVRVVEIDGNPWFVAADVCRALGLIGWASTYTMRLAETEKTVIRKGDVSSFKLETLLGNKQPSLSLVTESGLYKLVLRSRKPDAEDFKDWVTSEVLPRIRKDGMYVKDEEKIDLADDDMGRDPTAAPLGTLRSPARPLLDQPPPFASLRSDRSP